MGNCVGGKSGKKDPKILTEDEIKLLLANTRLNRTQIHALHQNFLRECPTGKLTKKDFVKLFKEVHPSENKKEKADKFCQYVFKVIDRDNQGYISFQDFVLCFSLTSDGDFKQKCEFAFRLYDLDKDGKISKKEMTQVLTALYDLSGITDRKGAKAPAKKVDEIIKSINYTYQEPEPEPVPLSQLTDKERKKAEKEAAAKKKADEKARAAAEKFRKANEKLVAAGKKPKEPKPVKVKLPTHISKEQFIEACDADEQLRHLFVDSIFSNAPEANLTEAATVTLVPAENNNESAGVTIVPGSIAVNSKTSLPTVSVDASDLPEGVQVEGDLNVVKTTTHIDLNEPNAEPVSVTTTTNAHYKNGELVEESTTTTNNNINNNETNETTESAPAETEENPAAAEEEEEKTTIGAEAESAINAAVDQVNDVVNELGSTKVELTTPKVALSAD